MCAQQRRDPEEVWRQYVEWRSGRLTSGVSRREEYRERLLSEGMPPAAVEERLDIIDNRRLREWHGRWPRRRGESFPEEALLEAQPSDFLAEVVGNLTPGPALDTAIGSGINVVYLARRGWKVTAIDISDVSLALVRERARRAGVPVQTVHSSPGGFYYGRGEWDLVVMLYPAAGLTPSLGRRVAQALRPGGLVVCEHLLDTGPASDLLLLAAEGRFRPGESRRAFGMLDIVRDETVTKHPAWGSPVQRLLARKP